MYLECTCCGISEEKLESIMRGARRMSYRKLVKLIKDTMPDLYYDLGLKYHNPYSAECRQTDTHYILVHSAIEYFIRKESYDE